MPFARSKKKVLRSELMPTNETENLVRSIVEGLSAYATSLDNESITALPGGELGALESVQGHTSAAEQTIERALAPIRMQTATSRESAADAGRLAAEVEQLRRVVAPPMSTTQSASDTASRTTENSGGSVAETVLKTAGMITGVGPIAAGLMALFGSRSSDTTTYPTMPFEPPPPISVEAGLGSDRHFTGISYTADGVPRSTSSTTDKKAASTTAPIQINVQAMDSRSFLDHSDDIARAVREAMLHSHSLNDVVSEL
jgi:hypothetical protein